MRSVTEVVASLVTPPTYRLDPTLRSPVVDASLVDKWLATLRFMIVEDDIVVVASLEVPSTTNGPVEVEPVGLERKLRFSVQADPFQ